MQGTSNVHNDGVGRADLICTWADSLQCTWADACKLWHILYGDPAGLLDGSKAASSWKQQQSHFASCWMHATPSCHMITARSQPSRV